MQDILFDIRWLENSILEYEKEPIEKGKILFYGHSLFTRWGPKHGHRRMDEDIRAKDGSLAVVNHGFGTSTSEELVYYYDRMVRPWEPRALVIATSGNDYMYGFSVDHIMSNVIKLCTWARADFPGIKIFLCEPHPAPKHKNDPVPDKWNDVYYLRDRFKVELRQYAAQHEDTKVIELWNQPAFFETPEDVGDPHKVREDIFVADKVHPNQAGYDILGPIFRKALDEVL